MAGGCFREALKASLQHLEVFLVRNLRRFYEPAQLFALPLLCSFGVKKLPLLLSGALRYLGQMDGEGCRCGSAGTWTFHSGVVTGLGRSQCEAAKL